MYLPYGESEMFPLGDPIDRLVLHLIASGDWDDERHADLQREIDAEVDAAFREADSHGSVKSGVIPDVATMFDDVFSELPRHLREQRDEATGAILGSADGRG